MKKILLILIVSITILGCGEKPTTLTLNFNAVYDNAPLLMDEITDYTYHDGTSFKMTGLRFYISDVKLYAGSDVVELIDIEDIDFTSNNKTSTGATEGLSFEINDPIPNDYDKIEFSIGVSAASNALTTTDFGYDHPLGPSNQAEYWDSWDSYIFAKVEGRQDSDNDGEYDSFTYHTGMDQMHRTRSISRSITIAEEKENTIDFIVEAKNVFTNGTLVIDIVGDPVVHTLPTNQASMIFSEQISDNLINSISIK